MRIVVERILRVRPEMNPGLGIPEMLENRPGISHRSDYKVDEYDWVTKAGLRAIERTLRRDGYVPEDEPVEFVFTA